MIFLFTAYLKLILSHSFFAHFIFALGETSRILHHFFQLKIYNIFYTSYYIVLLFSNWQKEKLYELVVRTILYWLQQCTLILTLKYMWESDGLKFITKFFNYIFQKLVFAKLIFDYGLIFIDIFLIKVFKCSNQFINRFLRVPTHFHAPC